MNKLILFLTAFLFLTNSYSQSFFINIGQNNSSINYTNSLNQEISELKNKDGYFIEAGISANIKSKKKLKTKWIYNGSITLNQFNSEAFIYINEYSWDTEYLGVKNSVKYNLFNNDKGLNINLNSGLTFLQIISGEQRINNTFYNLKNNQEFKGIFYEPHIGFEISYSITNNAGLHFGYNISKAKRLKGRNTGENFDGFNNKRIYLGFNLKI